MKCKDCAFEKGYDCLALTNKTRRYCQFAKTQEELDSGRKKAAERIKALPVDLQRHIASKYYDA